MTRAARQLLRVGAVGAVGAAMGAVLTLGALAFARSDEEATKVRAEPDAGVASAFVVRARRGEVLAPGVEDIESMCALLTSCERLPIPRALVPPDFQACTRKMADDLTSASAVGFSLTMRECGLTSSSCASLRSCALHGARRDACRGRGRQGAVGFCDVEGRALTCWHDEVMAVRDCRRGGENCTAENGEARCSLGPCDADASVGAPRCSASGTHVMRCESGRWVSLDCLAFGLACRTAPDGTASCATNGPPCSGANRCEGEVAIRCFNHREVRVDCAAAGLSCNGAPDAATVGACTAPPPPTPACTPDEKARCEGATIRYCYAGTARSYSCKALGFRSCELGKDGVRCAS
ncbi:MAG: hypothetical protein M3O36_21630 [Myxococcota bacterium]|nr:hypothetical protein [Myxococcota bacterium]